MKIIFATGNAGKAVEVKMIFSKLNIDVLTLKEAEIDIEIEENGKTFEENSYIKAKAVAAHTNEIVLADDSGLVIDYLNGEPGIHSARYMGEDTSYDIKNNEILRRMKDAVDEERSARFVCAMTAIMPNGEVIKTQETMEGLIAHEISGANGFGYDPIFCLAEYGMTSADISAETKNEISHRGKALKAMYKELERRIQV